MKIDLQADAKSIYDHLKERVAEYPIYINNGPGEDEDSITEITLGYSVCQAGWAALVFDTRPDGEPDGEWQDYIEENSLDFPHWCAAEDALYDNNEPIEITLPNGTKTKSTEGLVEHVGEMLKELLLKARKEKQFHGLPLAKNCCMGVEDHVGAYGWPVYKNRQKEGRVT